jgi:Tfp pilus assembly protein PilE
MDPKRSVISSESGSVFWRLLIIILSVAVVLSVLIPQLNQKREEDEITQCRVQMAQIAEAEEEYRETRGLYTDQLDSLEVFLPETGAVVCPTDGRPYIISAVDSTSYTISCPNDHGLVNTGKMSWEKK